jgi:UDP-glucose:(heptosyl)LPS alpha-1,3-glucosyltransferase
VIANSKLVKNEIVREFGYTAENIAVIYNGVPPVQINHDDGRRAEWRRKWELRDQDFALLFAGSGWERKGLHYAIEAVRMMNRSNLLLLVAGSGIRPAATPPNVRFLGPVTDMASLYAASDLFILPTIYDPFSNACLEALAFGMPVITTKSNGFAEVVESGIHGQIVDLPNDIGAIRDAVDDWSAPDRREAARPKCALLASQFSMDRNLHQTLEVLEALAK